MHKPFSRSNYATLMAADTAGLSLFTLEKLLYWAGEKKQLKTTNLVSKLAQKELTAEPRSSV